MPRRGILRIAGPFNAGSIGVEGERVREGRLNHINGVSAVSPARDRDQEETRQ